MKRASSSQKNQKQRNPLTKDYKGGEVGESLTGGLLKRTRNALGRAVVGDMDGGEHRFA